MQTTPLHAFRTRRHGETPHLHPRDVLLSIRTRDQLAEIQCTLEIRAKTNHTTMDEQAKGHVGGGHKYK